MSAINSVVSFNGYNKTAFKSTSQTPVQTQTQTPEITFKQELKKDVVELDKPEDLTPPEIGMLRLGTGFLTDEQVAQINKTKKLPSNAKFVPNAVGQYRIVNNFINLTVGTQTLPEGFEVKKNILGQAVVLPKGSDGLFIK